MPESVLLAGVLNESLNGTNRAGRALLAAACALIPVVAWSKDAAVAVLLLGVIGVFAQPATRAALFSRARFTPAAMFGLAFAAWSLISFAWAPQIAWSDGLKAAGAVAMIVAAVRCLLALPRERIVPLARPLTAAALVLLGLLVAERLTGGFFIGLERVGDSKERLFDLISPGLALLCCLLYPVAVLLYVKRGLVPGAGLVAACFVLGLTYRMDAAPVATGAAAISFAVVAFFRRPGFFLVIAGIAVVALAWGPVAAWARADEMQAWFTAHANYNWGYRIEIWNRVYRLANQAPWLGHGFDSARVLGAVQSPEVSFIHPHNGLLQVRVELGWVGVLLFLAAVAAGAREVATRVTAPLPLAAVAAAVTSTTVFWSISFGIWQGWWIAAIGITLCASVIVARITQR